MAKSKAHPGFKAIQNQIAKREGVSKKQAGAILAAASRKASPAAKRKNPNLKKVTVVDFLVFLFPLTYCCLD